MRGLVLAVLLSACAGQVTTGDPVDVNAHCGLAGVRVEWDGSDWVFASPPEQANPPPGWDQQAVVYVERVNGEVVAHGPDGKDWLLVEADGPPSPYGCL